MISTVAWLLVGASLLLWLTIMAGFLVGYRRARATYAIARCPRVSILKPLAGADEDLADNLRSFASVDYPSFEILFGVADRDDPALPIARAFIAAHPSLDARLVFTDRRAATNPKVAQLVELERQATGEIVLVSDSNVRVGRDYLYGIVAELLHPNAGLVSSVVVGTGERSLGAALENLQLAAAIAPGVVAASVLTAKPLTVGKSLGMWRRELARLGGFASVAEVLAEDHVLGRRFREAGYGVRISLQAVENRNVGCSVTRTIERHTRWAQMRRAIVPHAFWFEWALNPAIVALGALVLAPSARTALLLVVATALQMLGAAIAASLLPTTLGVRHVLLEPLRIMIIQVCWLRAALSRRVEWRGHSFVLGRDSLLVPAPPRARLARA